MVVRIRGEASNQHFDYEATILSRTDDELVLRTADGHTAVIRPRYVGSTIGSDDGMGKTICGFMWDGHYIALASFSENQHGDILVVPHDYS
jgi:hypothetical protein